MIEARIDARNHKVLVWIYVGLTFLASQCVVKLKILNYVYLICISICMCDVYLCVCVCVCTHF